MNFKLILLLHLLSSFQFNCQPIGPKMLPDKLTNDTSDVFKQTRMRRETDETLEDDLVEDLLSCGIFVTSSVGMVFLGPAAVGLRSAGIARKSIMAGIQSTYGNVPKHSWFSAVQSWTYRSNGLALQSFRKQFIVKAFLGDSCIDLLGEFWDELPDTYFGDRAIEIYKDFADEIKDFGDDIEEFWKDDFIPELEYFFEKRMDEIESIWKKSLRFSQKIGKVILQILCCLIYILYLICKGLVVGFCRIVYGIVSYFVKK